MLLHLLAMDLQKYQRLKNTKSILNIHMLYQNIMENNHVFIGIKFMPKVDSVCIFNAYGPRVRTTGAYGAVFGVLNKN